MTGQNNNQLKAVKAKDFINILFEIVSEYVNENKNNEGDQDGSN